MTARLLLPLSLTLLLAACEIPGLGPDPRVAQREADGKAIGGACRYSMRAIEDCYALNENASRAAVFSGWKDMDQYMRENKVEGVPPKVTVKTEPEEEVVEDSKSKKPGAKDKTAAGKSGDGKTVAVAVAKDAAKAPVKPAEKAAPAKASH
jgi:hypothetical protein